MARLDTITSIHQIANAAFDPLVINVMDEKYLVIADGTSHPLSERYSTVAEAQAAYPLYADYIDALDLQIDSCGIMEAYLDAMVLEEYHNLRGNSSRFGVDSSFAANMQLKIALLIPRGYYRVTLDRVWFSSRIDIYGDGAGFIGDDVENTGRNYQQYPDEDQEPQAGAVLTIGEITHDNAPAFVTASQHPRNVIYRLPMIFADNGYAHDGAGVLEDFVRGIGLRVCGMYACRINVEGIYGLFYCGMVFSPRNEGMSFNEFALGEVAGALLSYKFNTLGEGSGSSTWITSNRIEGGNNLGVGHSYYSDPGNSGILFDFDNQPHKLHNFPYPSGTAHYWKVGHTEIENFHVEDRHQATMFRLNHVSTLTVRRSRGEAWGYPMFSGYSSEAVGYGTTVVPRSYNIEVDTTSLTTSGDFASVKGITLEDWASHIPTIQYLNEYSTGYPNNPVRIVSRNAYSSEGTEAVKWNGMEEYNYIPGAGPVVTSTDGLKAFRLQMKEDGGEYTLTPQEVGMPIAYIRAAATTGPPGAWQVLRDGVNYEPLTISISGYVDIQPRFSIGASDSYGLQAYWKRMYLDESLTKQYDTVGYMHDYATNDLFQMQVEGPGVYSLILTNRLTSALVSGMAVDPLVSGYSYPPFTNARTWDNLVVVEAE